MIIILVIRIIKNDKTIDIRQSACGNVSITGIADINSAAINYYDTSSISNLMFSYYSSTDVVDDEYTGTGYITIHAFDNNGAKFDEKGNLITGDHILYIYGKYMKKREKLVNNTVVTTVMSNFGLYKAFDKLGIDYAKTAVGDKYVYENMKVYDHLIGGEQSGHIIFRKHARTGDGLITAIMVMSVMIDTQLPLSTLAEGCKSYPQVLKNVVVDDKDETMSDQKVMDAVSRCTEALGDSGRVLLRKSGTEPVLRVMSEAGTVEECEKYVNAIIQAMKDSGHLQEVKK